MEYNNSILNQPPQPSVGRPGKVSAPGGKRRKRGPNWLNGITMTLLISVALLIGGMIFIVSTSRNKSEMDLVDSSKFQAIFLDGGQVYFGKVKSMNNDYLVLNNVFYLRVGEQGQEAANKDVSLSKLGCELHGPQDQMVITRTSISFWENLKDDGQVTKAIAEFEKQNPNGQKCQEAGTSNQQSTNQAPATQNQQTPTNTEQQNNNQPLAP